jgi:hypothetical protein
MTHLQTNKQKIKTATKIEKLIKYIYLFYNINL